MDGDEDIEFGRIVLELGWTTREILTRARAWQQANAPQRRLSEVLVQGGVLTAEQAAKATAEQRRRRTARGPRGPITPPPAPPPGDVGWTPTAPQSPPHGVAGWAGAADLAAAPPGAGTAVAMGPTPRPEDEDPLLGAVLGGCFVNARLGAGAMATVYLAWHGELRKDVVIKVLSHEHTKVARTVERFRREASAMARVEHPNVVMVFDLGATPDGRPFTIMQYVDGQDLEKRMQARKRLEPDEATRVVLEVARGLEAAHAKGVIHRDVKPENIMLTSAGTAKVTDFGLAKDMTMAPMTLDGAIIGTPLYMAPEIGGKAPIDARVDVYSLGLTFYYLLTGVEPMREFSAHDVLYKVAHGKLRPPEAHHPDVPAAHRRVLGRMLARDRDERYPDMAAAARDLDALLRGAPVEAPSRPSGRPARRAGVQRARASAPPRTDRASGWPWARRRWGSWPSAGW
ncbi:MAG: serine/threonine protein kinase [Planctomycetes bacterium]|nr:serine/threonine protein kinase [Planctomycetota bacterium]